MFPSMWFYSDRCTAQREEEKTVAGTRDTVFIFGDWMTGSGDWMSVRFVASSGWQLELRFHHTQNRAIT